MTVIEKGHRRDLERARAAAVHVRAWRGRGELDLPRLPPEKIAEIDNTLAYPPDGSATLKAGITACIDRNGST